MMKAVIDLPETNTAIYQPVVNSVVNDIVSYIGVADDTHVTVTKDNSPFTNKNWNIGELKKTSDKGIQDEVVLVSFDESFDEDNAITTNIRHNDRKPVIYDPITCMEVKPVYMETTMKFNMKIISKSKSSLVNMMSKLRTLYVENKDISHHTIQYIYHLNREIYPLFETVMDIRNDVLGTDIGLEEFLMPMVDDRFTFTGNQSGTLDNITIAFKELQSNVVGYFTHDLLNSEITYDDKYYMVDLEYEFRFDRPFQYNLKYNQVVYNTVMPYEYIMVVDGVDNSVNANFTVSQDFESSLEVTTDMYNLMDTIRFSDEYLKIPTFDTHDNIKNNNYSLTLFSVLTIITDADKKFLFNLEELDDTFQLADEIIDFLKAGEYAFITTPLKSVYNLRLVKDCGAPVYTELVVDSDLNVFAAEDLDITGLYRVLFSIVPHGLLLEDDAKDRLLDSSSITSTTPGGTTSSPVGTAIDVLQVIMEENPDDNANTVNTSLLTTVDGGSISDILKNIRALPFRKTMLSYIIAKHIKTIDLEG